MRRGRVLQANRDPGLSGAGAVGGAGPAVAAWMVHVLLRSIGSLGSRVGDRLLLQGEVGAAAA